MSSPSMDLSNITFAKRELINQLSRNACGSHGTKATKYHDEYRTTRGFLSLLGDLGCQVSLGIANRAVGVFLNGVTRILIH